MLPAILLMVWIISVSGSGFDWIRTLIFLGSALLWFFLYPARFDRRVERYNEKALDESSHSKSLGPCELTLSDTGLHSRSNTGESTFFGRRWTE